ncbi:MAG: aminotransferase class I/II-fold pyridoxal phosphate-dependent enzyme [Faecalibacterium sp.]|nr:aminotransferase class I/II-fold pyridoxal phosphate-dependent enzyme [Ruminococcus sp.]MCM1392936.1 aminotransferase class I/II-fold pyridoxal phosphate-dependent enzyme [Ruminococcus sp.]MCM1485681.1 aminotransferase class I/II-fold pyridoxal phosphate-dependent enzyme [Faecalibacterium sp.]
MPNIKSLSNSELLALKAQLEKEYNDFKAKGLKLDMSRGKPGADQLAVSNGLLDAITSKDWDNDGTGNFEYRNYGVLTGIPECRALFADLLEVPSENVIVCGNSSLNMMFDYITQCMLTGSDGTPWKDQGEIKFLCPSPGYDRHFSICEYYGIKMIPIEMKEDGPDMDMIEELIKDSSVKGMFCVPKYSNPTGVTYSSEVVDRIAKMTPAASDFRIIWDNAYIIHDLASETEHLDNIFTALKKYGHEDMVIEFTSTSKISFPGAGVAVLAASDRNIEIIKSRMTIQTIGYDKLNQFRHVKYFKNLDGVKAHMKLHRSILAPKFKAVVNEFESSLGDYGVANWTDPNGGYFISLDVMDGTAKRVGELCKQAGVTLTTVGATYPYGTDPNDRNIRIAPSFPPVDELMTATKLLCICVKLAAVEKLLG